MILMAALALQAAAPDVAPDPGRDIVVYGRRLAEAHRACQAGGCSVLRDAQVSIALAEQQLRDGDYVKAKRTMAAAVARNRRHAATDPKPVAALYEAYATVSLQEGDLDAYRRAVGGQVRTLRDNLPEGDPARGDAALAVGDMWLALHQPRNAAQAYAAVERRAEAAGDLQGVLLARLRRAWLATTARPVLVWAPPYQRSADALAREDAKQFGEVTPATLSSKDSGSSQWAISASGSAPTAALAMPTYCGE